MSISLVENPWFNYEQGQCVYVKYDDQCHLGVVQNLNYLEYLVNIRCLIKPHSDSWWRLQPEINVVWFIGSNILGHAEHEAVMDEGEHCSNYQNRDSVKQNKFETFLQAVLQLCLQKFRFLFPAPTLIRVFMLVQIYFCRLFVSYHVQLHVILQG